ncbi:MAG: hypothetical protein Q9162_001531 [Coniocarpon cinnabarinum]
MTTSNNAESYEHAHVHNVYDTIAPHFSSTRYKPWPTPHRFLSSFPAGSIGIDAGCGNGKYLSSNPDVLIVGSDRSAPLVSIAAQNHVYPSSRASNATHENHGNTSRVKHDATAGIADVLVADALTLPHPDARFDFAISIAVLHHLSTRSRRIAGLTEILHLLRSPSATNAEGGKALVFVWALEQESSRRGWKEGGAQDVMVPWVMRSRGMPTHHREVTSRGKEKGRRKKEKSKDMKRKESDDEGLERREQTAREEGQANEGKEEEETVHQRYYHLYARGELESDVQSAGGRVLDSGYERDNWWCIMARAQPT